MNTCEFHWHADLEAENAKLRAEVALLRKNDRTEDYCAVCKCGIYEKEARMEDRGVWYHPLCKVANERDSALLQIHDLQDGFKLIRTMQKENHSLGDAQKVAAMALELPTTEKRKCDFKVDAVKFGRERCEHVLPCPMHG